jgi:hypothetical protein
MAARGIGEVSRSVSRFSPRTVWTVPPCWLQHAERSSVENPLKGVGSTAMTAYGCLQPQD